MLVALRSRRHIAPFTAERPATVAEALALRAASGRSAYLAGGTDLIDWLKQGHEIDRLIRLDGVPGLEDITSGPDGLQIGALATHAALIASPTLRTALPDLAALWPAIANPRVRLAGTIGGNVMAGRSEYDALPALLALGAVAEVATAHGPQIVALDALASLDAPLLTGFVIPDPAGCRLFADRSLRPAIAVWLGLAIADGQVTAVRLAVGMAHPTAVCVTLTLGLSEVALGSDAARIAAELAAKLPEPASDGRGSAGYRRRMAGVLARRILIRAGGAA